MQWTGESVRGSSSPRAAGPAFQKNDAAVPVERLYDDFKVIRRNGAVVDFHPEKVSVGRRRGGRPLASSFQHPPESAVFKPAPRSSSPNLRSSSASRRTFRVRASRVLQFGSLPLIAMAHLCCFPDERSAAPHPVFENRRHYL